MRYLPSFRLNKRPLPSLTILLHLNSFCFRIRRYFKFLFNAFCHLMVMRVFNHLKIRKTVNCLQRITEKQNASLCNKIFHSSHLSLF